jgi:hypothetical protein
MCGPLRFSAHADECSPVGPSQHVALKRSSVALKYDDPFRLPPDMELSIDDAKQLLPT